MKHILSLGLVFVLFSSQLSVAQNFQWAKKMGGTYNQSWSLPASDKGSSISVDADDNIIVGGIFKETSDFDPGPNTFNLTSQGGHDMFVTKLNASGDFLWAVSFGNDDASGDGDRGVSVDTDASGNVYCTGSFKGTVDFNPGSSTYELTSVGSSDIFVLKLSPTGDLIWVKQIAAKSSDFERTITIDPLGNVCLTGSFIGTVDFDPGVNSFDLSSAGSGPFPTINYLDAFVCKLDSDGEFLWAKALGGLSDDEGTSIITDNVGNIYTTGYFLYSADFDPSTAVYELTSAGYRSPFICKLDASGNLVWAKNFATQGSSATGTPSSIFVDVLGNVYTTGVFSGMIDFDPGTGTLVLDDAGSFSGSDAFVTKLDPSGNLEWAKQLGGNDDEEGYSILVDALGDVYTVGMYQADADFDPGPFINELEAVANSHDMFISKLSSAGDFVWAKSIGGNSPSKDIAWSMDFSSTGNIYVTGQFYATADFNPAGGTSNMTSSGSADIFVLALDGFATSGPSTGITDHNQITSLGLFPNPSQGMFTLSSPEYGRISIYNTLGERVIEKVVAEGKTIIELLEPTAGVYLYTFIEEMGKHTSGKIVVQ
jgi:hypothetical protein